MARQTEHTILQVIALVLERTSTVALAVLLLALHLKMAKAKSLDAMKRLLHPDWAWTAAVLAMLSVALVLSITDISLRQSDASDECTECRHAQPQE